ncbi:MAG: hypothetical protein RRY29_01045 [Desulfovibrionaceae bacterium]
MSELSNHIAYNTDAQGELVSVQLSAALWARVKSRVLAAEQALHIADNPYSRPEPLEAVDELKKYWDFKYPYAPDVRCEHCGTATMDWEQDPRHPFHLTNANFAGLLVFKCKHCGSTVRKKHFKDHVTFEVSPVTPSSR